MNKYFCDKCGAEIVFDVVSIKWFDEKNIIGEEHMHKNLCRKHKSEFVSLVNNFFVLDDES